MALWLENPGKERLHYLEESLNNWKIWLAHDWRYEKIKLWGNYHLACAEKALSDYETSKGEVGAATENAREYKEAVNDFLALARSRRGVEKYQVRFTAFFLTSADFVHFPGEPLPCGLSILEEFRLH